MTNIFRTTKDFTPEERSRLLDQYHASGLNYQEFAKEHNLSGQTLKNWIWISQRGGKVMHFSPVARKKMVEAYLAADIPRDQFCKTWGVSEPTLASWLKRYEEFGADGLMNKSPSRGDKRLGSKLPVAVKEEIIRIKQQEPEFGLSKIKNWLYRFRGVKVSTGSIRKTVTNEGLPLAKKPRKRRRSSERVRRFERAKPMQLWQSDITQFTLGQYWSRVYLTVFMDDHSRYIVGWRLQSRQTAELVIDAFKDAVTRFGKPEEVLTDQGRQYFAWRGKSELEKLLEKNGIKHVVSRAHHPQTLGKCERFWETVGNEFWTRVKPQDPEEARVRLKYFIDHYNHQRPHQGLNGQVPADRFFGVAEEVREAIEKTVEQNALNMAVGELPKPPAFLIGQVGDQRIAFHGSSGRFYLTHENLGGETIGEQSSGATNESTVTGAEETSEEKIVVDRDQDRESSDAGPLGERLGGGKGDSKEESSSDHGVLDGSNDKGGSGDRVEREADPILAADETSADGVNGGVGAAAPL